jgi:NAD+ diphosphatase
VTYPRISPAIITLVRRGDEALLANSGRFPVPMFSTLAGFCEVGESLEETLVREVREEVGLEVANVRYFGSQPWPFPNSLMIGFTADWAAGDIQVDGEEIKEARFFAADALPRIPPRLSIAWSLINAWVREVTGADAPGRSKPP